MVRSLDNGPEFGNLDSLEIAIYDAHRDFTSKYTRSGCYAGHTSMLFDSIGRVRICSSNSEFILGDLRVDRLDDIWTGPRRAMLREALDRYDFGLGCSECEVKIRAGILDGATCQNSQITALKFENFHIQRAPLWPKYLEFHLSNKCNLECVTCSGVYSSLIRANREKLPAFSLVYGDQFFEDLRKYLPHVEEAEFKGGEPFLIPEMYRVWDMLIEEELSPRCHITTNGTVFGPKVERILTSLPVSVNVSVDGISSETFEAIRVNAKLERVLKNARRIRDIVVSRGFSFGFNYTLSRMNWHEFVDFLLYAESENVPVSVSNVQFPSEMSLFKWGRKQIQRVIDQLQTQLINAEQRLKRNKDLLEKKIQELRFALEKRVGEQEEVISLVNLFHGAVAGPETMMMSRDRAISLLTDWSTAKSVCEIQCDSEDNLTFSESGELSVFSDASSAGLKFADWIAILFSRCGSKVIHTSLIRDAGHIDRVFRIEGGSAPAIEMRVIMMPLFDSDGRLQGARALFSNRAESVVPV
jgi:MoaA/NifB/PqqE/SkfB family radical SAM enzyme